MEGQEVDLPHGGDGGGETGDGLQSRRIVIDAWDKRDTDPDLAVDPAEGAQVLEDEAVRGAGVLLVPGGVHQLEVIEEEVGQRGDGQQVLGGGQAAGVHGGVEAARAAGPEAGAQELELQERFAPGEGDAAAGFVIKDAVLPDGIEDLEDGHLLTSPPAGLGWASGHACAAERAAFVARRQGVRSRDGCSEGAGAPALAAVETTALQDDDLAPG